MTRTVYLRLAYDGTAFHGWQQQPGLRTVQGTLEQAARRVVRHQVEVTGSGRTDAGVHALGQVAHFRTDCTIPAARLRYALGARLPKDVSIICSHDVHPDFHATQSAQSKLYRYRVFNARHRPVERLVQHQTYHYWQTLDVDRMAEAAAHFIGTMDFAAMASAGAERLTTVRTVFGCAVSRHCDEVRIEVEGGGFLYNQVRNMVGTLLEVGRGRWEPAHVAEILASCDRQNAGPLVPARGLCLQWVRYPAQLLRPPTPTGAAGISCHDMALEDNALFGTAPPARPRPGSGGDR